MGAAAKMAGPRRQRFLPAQNRSYRDYRHVEPRPSAQSRVDRTRVSTYEADAFAKLLKRTTYDDCVRHSNRVRRYPDGRPELEVMWSAVQLVEQQFAEAGFAPR